MKRASFLKGVGALALAPAVGRAQGAWPDKQIRMVIPFAAGGTTDLLARALGQHMTQAWGQLEAAKAQIEATQAQVAASEIALNGVREEARVGQRTTLDVLNAVQALVNARVALVTAQHDYVVTSYSVLNAVGRLSPQVLNLKTNIYDPSVHYHQVRDSWIGVRTPDGR